MSADLSASERVLGTAEEEFDIATGYWAKWQRCKDEKAELLGAVEAVMPLLEDWHEDDGRVSPVWRKCKDAIANAKVRE